MKILKLVKHTNNKFLNFYELELEKEKVFHYYFVSRRQTNKVGRKDVCDAVKVLPFIEKTKEIVFIKNFRPVVNDFVYEVPAGLVDKNEEPEVACARELKEEIGAKVTNLIKVLNNSFVSVGLSDETVECYFASVELDYSQKLDECEEIEIIKVPLEKAPEFLNSHQFDAISFLLAELFLQKK